MGQSAAITGDLKRIQGHGTPMRAAVSPVFLVGVADSFRNR